MDALQKRIVMFCASNRLEQRSSWQMSVRQRVGSETCNIESAHERDEILPPPPPRSRPMSGIASTGPTATVSREFVRSADAVDAKPPSKPVFW
jgi:hypothetical protein